jgi:hypothetical protein
MPSVPPHQMAESPSMREMVIQVGEPDATVSSQMPCQAVPVQAAIHIGTAEACT